MPLEIADGASELLNDFKEMLLEYANELGFSLCFQGFDEEVAGLPWKYAEPEGCVLVARRDGEVAGCVALKPLEPGVCEMKRLFVRPAFRGTGIGKALAYAVVDAARKKGYKSMKLDTLRTMTSAQALYKEMGFIQTEPYVYNPMEEVVFLELDLKP